MTSEGTILIETAKRIKPIHPFAARMAPEIAFEALEGLSKKSFILDPMSGSGTVMRTISELGYRGMGLDIDPLSVLMSKAWTSKVDEQAFLKKSQSLLASVEKLKRHEIFLPWIDDDQQTKKFIEFWFASQQISDLRKLSYVVNNYKREYSAVYKIALSRLIITKGKGASLAADVSHSRPHRVRDTNDFDVFDEFEKSCKRISKTIDSTKLLGKIDVKRGDARRLKSVKNGTVDAIITSPPYLNALDYMRGHKLSLVWLGHKIGDLATIRSGSVGAEKAPNRNSSIIQAKHIVRNIEGLEDSPQKIRNMVYRYALDMQNIVKESSRVLRKNRQATFVIGNSSLKGVYINNTEIAAEAAQEFGLKLVETKEREIPQNKRYLPPPKNTDSKGLNARMKTETIMTFRKIK